MTNTTAKLELENLLLRAVVESKDEYIAKLQRENDWLSLVNAGLKSKVEHQFPSYREMRHA